VVAAGWPEALPALDRSLFDAHFAQGLAIDDPEVVGRLVAAAGADADEVARLVAEGAGAGAVDRSKEDAFDAGATGTPSWLIDGRGLIPGLQDRRMFERVVSRLAQRPDGADSVSGAAESGIPD
jgi:predicted DsbA family dithiol-disulfide isomerase